MLINNIEIQDGNGSVYYPHTDASVVKFGDSTVGATLSDVVKSGVSTTGYTTLLAFALAHPNCNACYNGTTGTCTDTPSGINNTAWGSVWTITGTQTTIFFQNNQTKDIYMAVIDTGTRAYISTWRKIITDDYLATANNLNNLNTCVLGSNDIQVLSNNTVTKKALQVVNLDGNSMATTGASAKITIKEAGYYLVIATAQFTGNVTGNRSVTIYKNGSGFTSSSSPGGTGDNTILNTSYVLYCDATNYFELYVWEDCGGNLNCFSCGLTVRRLG